MAEQSQRARIVQAIETLPPDATFDDAIERLVFLAKIDAGIAELDAGEGIPHREVKRRLGL
jgi:predicted transcriptional regulator